MKALKEMAEMYLYLMGDSNLTVPAKCVSIIVKDMSLAQKIKGESWDLYILFKLDRF